MLAHMTRNHELKVRLALEVIAYLNEILALDPEAILALCEHRVPATARLANHETTQVSGLQVGLLGILNGLVGVRDDQWGYITAVYDDTTGKLTRFELTKQGEMHPGVGDKPFAEIDAAMVINGRRRSFVDSVQYYLNELLEDDSPLHVIGHIESECRDYEQLIRDAVKVYGVK